MLIRSRLKSQGVDILFPFSRDFQRFRAGRSLSSSVNLCMLNHFSLSSFIRTELSCFILLSEMTPVRPVQSKYDLFISL